MFFHHHTLADLIVPHVFGDVSVDIRLVVLPLYQLKRTRTPEVACKGVVIVDTKELAP